MFCVLLVLIGAFPWPGSRKAHAHVPHDVVADLHPSPAFSKDRTVFAIIRNTLYRSTDGGNTWYRLSKGLGRNRLGALALSPRFREDRTLYVAGLGSGVFRSTDGGTSWVHRSNGIERPWIRELAIARNGKSKLTLLAIGPEGELYRTDDAGETWARSFDGNRGVTTVLVVGNRFVLGTERGELHEGSIDVDRWRMIGRLPTTTSISALSPLDPSSNGALLVGTAGNGIMQVSGAAETFRCRPLALDGHHVTAISQLPETAGPPLLLVATWEEAVLRSEDGGRTWSKHDDGLARTPQAVSYHKPHFTHLARTDDSTLFLGGFCGVHRSVDGGRTWEKLVTLGVDDVLALVTSPATSKGHELAVSTYGSGAYTTADGGESWETRNHGTYKLRMGAMAYSPGFAGDRTLFSSSYNGILRSKGGEAHWRALPFPRPPFDTGRDRFVFPISYALSPRFPNDGSMFIGMYPAGILGSRDGGESFSWVWDTSGKRVFTVAVSPGFPEDGTVLVSLSDGIHRSTDGGLEWKRVGHAHLGRSFIVISPRFVNDRTLFAGNEIGLFRSRDGGKNWDRLPLTDPEEGETPVGGLAISPDFDRDRLLMVQIQGGDLLLCRDRTTGFECTASEAARSGFEFSHSPGYRERNPLIAFSPRFREDQTVYGASAWQLARSTDGGRTWQEIRKPVRYEAEACIGLFLPMTLRGEWAVAKGREHSGRLAIRSMTPASAVALTFMGREVRVIGTRGPGQGAATVLLDDRDPQRIDLTSKVRTPSAIWFTATGLEEGPHRIQVEVAGWKNPGAAGSWVEIDAFEVYR